MIFRRRRPILLGSALMVLLAAVFALPVFGELGNENDFDDPSAEAVAARAAITDSTGAFAAPSLVDKFWPLSCMSPRMTCTQADRPSAKRYSSDRPRANWAR